MITQQGPSLAKNLLRSSALRSSRLSSSPAVPSNQTIEQSNIIFRHGVGDGVVTLNVGGKTFLTLRSTVSQNAVLMDHVTRAEANKEIALEAVFIDRDPKHFGMILSYLRNKADGVSTRSSGGVAARLRGKSNIPTLVAETVYLPQDQQSLQEMYYESVHYDIPELASHICTRGTLVKYLNMSGVKNPFQMAASALAIGKRIMVFLGTVATGMGGWVVTQATLSEAQAKQSYVASSSSSCEEISKNEQIVRNLLKAWEDSAGKK